MNYQTLITTMALIALPFGLPFASAERAVRRRNTRRRRPAAASS